MQVNVREDLKHLLKDLNLLKYPAATLGVAEGLFDRDILNWGIAKLFSVDAWEHQPNTTGDGNSSDKWHNDNYNHAKELLSQFGHRSVMVKAFTHEAATRFPDNHFGFIYIDANHGFEDVLTDLKLWWPKLKEGGIIAGHDYLNPAYGVYQAVNLFFAGLRLTVNNIPDIAIENAGFWVRKPITEMPVFSGEIKAQ